VRQGQQLRKELLVRCHDVLDVTGGIGRKHPWNGRKPLTKQVISSRNGMDIPRQMEVEFIHGYHLRIPTARRATFDTKRGTLTGLPDTCESGSSKVSADSLREAYGRCGFPFSEGGGGDAGRGGRDGGEGGLLER
jgi:hypothetical protein